MSLFNMVARFTDENILKVSLNPDNDKELNITLLDEDGDEVNKTLNMELPKMIMTAVNNLSSPIKLGGQKLTGEGVNLIDFHTLNPGDSVTFECLYGTPDGSTYVATYIYSWTGNPTVTISDTVNCVEYGTYIVIGDKTKDSSCTITVS